jgi:poly(A) polymerase
MKLYPLPSGPATPEQQGALEAVQRLQKAGFIAFFAGGCVRDLVMGRTPKDYDLATNAIPDKVLDLFPESVAVGKSFGVIRVQVANHWYEVATFRKDAAYSDGRHPESVTFSDPETDAERRDFTINALFYDPVRQELLDYVQGMEDIAQHRVRTVGDPEARFREDRLRLLRAVRFAATLEFTLDPATAAAIRAAAPGIVMISAERIREELTRILTEARHVGEALIMLSDLALLEAILPEVAVMHGTEQPPEFHPEGDVFKHTVLMLNALHTTDPQLAWAVLLHDVGKPPTAQLKEGRWRFERHAGVGAEVARRILERLRFSSDDAAAIGHMVGNHMRFVDVKEMRRSTLRQLVGAPTFVQELELHRLDCLASHGDLENYGYLVAFLDQMRSEPVLPDPWVSGRDVMALGIPEGRDVGVWRKKAYEAQLEGVAPDRDHLLTWLRNEVAASDKAVQDSSRKPT